MATANVNESDSRKLSVQTKNVSGVLNFPLTGEKDKDLALINDYSISMLTYLRSIAVEFWCIVHWEDEPDQQTLEECDTELQKAYFLQGVKIPHLHFVFRSEKRARLLTWIANIANAVGYDRAGRNLVSVEVCRCFPFAIQYLIHLNHPEKHQYSLENIITNVSPEQLRFYLNSDGTYVDPHTLLKLVSECDTQTEIILRLGIETYMRFRPVITTMFMEYKQNPALLHEPTTPVRKYKKDES